MNKTSTKILSGLLLAMLILSVVCNVTIIVGGQIYPVVLKCLSGVALIATFSALYYTFKGYSKNAASSYKAYMIITAVYFQAICVANAIVPEQFSNTLSVGFFALTNSMLFGLFLLLAIAKDMGKKQTYTICWIAFVLTILALIECVLWDKSTLQQGLAYLLLTRVATRFILVANACFMVYFKYQNKESRGTK